MEKEINLDRLPKLEKSLNKVQKERGILEERICGMRESEKNITNNHRLLESTNEESRILSWG